MNELNISKISTEDLIKELNKRISKKDRDEIIDKSLKKFREAKPSIPKTIDEWKEYDLPDCIVWTLSFMDSSKKYTFTEISKEFIFRERWARENKVYPYND